MIYNIYDLPIYKIARMEEVVFAAIAILAALVVFQDIFHALPSEYFSIYQAIYLISMNALIGLKVACGFVLLFYRYVAIERE
jgi:hypothetical protein